MARAARNHASGTTGKARKTAKRALCPQINSCIISAADTGSIARLVDTIVAYESQMNLVNLATAFHRIARLSMQDPAALLFIRRHPLPSRLAASALAALGRAEASVSPPHCQALSNLVWSLAALELAELPLLQALAASSTKRVPSFKPFELSAILWGFGHLCRLEGREEFAPIDFHKSLFKAAMVHIMGCLDAFPPRCLEMVAWAFDVTQQDGAGPFRELAGAAKMPRQEPVAARARQSPPRRVGEPATGGTKRSRGQRRGSRVGAAAPKPMPQAHDSRPPLKVAARQPPVRAGDCAGAPLSEALPEVTLVVKNTFIDVVDGTEPDNSDIGAPAKPLPPALDCIPAEVSTERLESFRLDYQRFRAGSALGARGEVWSSVACVDGGDEEGIPLGECRHETAEAGACAAAAAAAASAAPPGAEAAAGANGAEAATAPAAPAAAPAAPVAVPKASPAGPATEPATDAFSGVWTVKNSFLHVEEVGASCDDDDFIVGASLPPPLGIIPEDVSLEKLIEYRLHYLRFRAGFAVGARGEVESSLMAG